jgi:hypothetical protein
MIRTYSAREMHEVVKRAVNEADNGGLRVLPSDIPVVARAMTQTSPKQAGNRNVFMIDTGTRNVTPVDHRLVASDSSEGVRMRVLHLPQLEGTPDRTLLPNKGWFAKKDEEPELEGWLRPIASAVVRIAVSDAMGHTGQSGELKQTVPKDNLGPLSNWLIAMATNEGTAISTDEATEHFLAMSAQADAENAATRLEITRMLVARTAEGFSKL